MYFSIVTNCSFVALAIFGLQIGRNDSTGHFNSIQFPYWLMVWVRKNLYTEWLPGTIDGSRL